MSYKLGQVDGRLCKMSGWLPTSPPTKIFIFCIIILIEYTWKSRASGINLNWLKQFRRLLAQSSRVKRLMNLQAGLCPELDDEAGLQVLFASYCYFPGVACSILKEAYPFWQQWHWQHLGIHSIQSVSNEKCTSYAEENEFSSQNPIQRSLPYNSLWWDDTTCMNLSQASGMGMDAWSESSMIHTLWVPSQGLLTY